MLVEEQATASWGSTFLLKVHKTVLFDWQKVPKTKCTVKIAGVSLTTAERIRKTTLFAHSFRAQSLRSPLYPQFSQCIPAFALLISAVTVALIKSLTVISELGSYGARGPQPGGGGGPLTSIRGTPQTAVRKVAGAWCKMVYNRPIFVSSNRDAAPSKSYSLKRSISPRSTLP